MYTSEFYRNVVNPESKNFRHLYLAVTEQPNGKKNGRDLFPLYYTENSLTAAKKKLKSWADILTKEGCCVIIKSVVEVKEKK
jgi:hypothetical protein